MLRANLADGRTLCFDLHHPDELERWRSAQSDGTFQSSIRGISIIHDRRVFVLPLPRRFSRLSFSAEVLVANGAPVGERVACQADDVEVSCTVYYGDTRMARMDLVRTGHARFRPQAPAWSRGNSG